MRRIALAAASLLWLAPAAGAHPAPLSFVDLVLDASRAEVGVVAHVYDLAHELRLDPPERLLDPARLQERQRDVAALIAARLQATVDGRDLACVASAAPTPLPERSAVRVPFSCHAPGPVAHLRVRAVLFPYDPRHQTFFNVYERGTLQAQAIVDGAHPQFEYFSGTGAGRLAVVERFLPAGVHHILVGPDHLLFLVGLLLLGGSWRRLALVVTAFTAGHSLTLSLAALGMLTLPARIVEPAIALSVVYVGADNLLVRGGRDVRAWVALLFGLVHGLGFAGVLQSMDLPRPALVWSLASFNLGVEIGQLAVVLAVASMLAALRARSQEAGRRLAMAGSIGVVMAGSSWFVQRLLFP